MHFEFKIRITTLTVILDLKVLNVGSVKYFLSLRFGYGFQTWKTRINSVILNMLMKILQSPKFLSITEIRRTLTSNIDDPCNCVICNLYRTTFSLIIK